MGAPKSGKQALAAHTRQLRALALRKRGTSYDAIAAALGYAGKSGAYKAVARALHETLREATEEVRALELGRLDIMLTSVWDRAAGGDCHAIEIVLKLQDRRAKLLGLDQPLRVDVETRIRMMAADLGLDADEVVAEAGRIIRSGRD